MPLCPQHFEQNQEQWQKKFTSLFKQTLNILNKRQSHCESQVRDKELIVIHCGSILFSSLMQMSSQWIIHLKPGNLNMFVWSVYCLGYDYNIAYLKYPLHLLFGCLFIVFFIIIQLGINLNVHGFNKVIFKRNLFYRAWHSHSLCSKVDHSQA